MVATKEELQHFLKHHFGYATFKPGQLAVIQQLLTPKDTVAIMPTGNGKSLCLFKEKSFNNFTVIILDARSS